MKLIEILIALACLVANFRAIEVWPEDRTRTIGLICKHFCNDASYSYDLSDFYDYFDYWRNVDDEEKPKIFCKLCKKKMSTTTPSATTSTTPASPATEGTSTTSTETSTVTTEATSPTTKN